MGRYYFQETVLVQSETLLMQKEDSLSRGYFIIVQGPSRKYVTLEGGKGVREGVTVCDRGRGPRACDVTLFKLFHTYET